MRGADVRTKQRTNVRTQKRWRGAVGALAVTVALALFSACQPDTQVVVEGGAADLGDDTVAIATSPPLVVDPDPTPTGQQTDGALAQASARSTRAVETLDAGEQDALGTITQAALGTCFDRAVEADAGSTATIEAIAATAPGAGLSQAAAELVARCLVETSSADAVMENFSDDGLLIGLDEARCASEAYRNGDPQALVDDLVVDAISPSPSREVLAATFACASSETLASWLATVDVAATNDEARCFYSALPDLDDDASFQQRAEQYRCLSDAALDDEFGRNLEAIDHTPDELRCAVAGILALTSDPDETFAEYAACGIAGRTFAFGLSLNRGVPLSDPTISCLDEAFASMTTTDEAAQTEAFDTCATPAEREAEAAAPG